MGQTFKEIFKEEKSLLIARLTVLTLVFILSLFGLVITVIIMAVQSEWANFGIVAGAIVVNLIILIILIMRINRTGNAWKNEPHPLKRQPWNETGWEY
tara:strand:+ start:148 stop:441 length:294 start_codon:yes stop_codon:yes gene_type:complete